MSRSRRKFAVVDMLCGVCIHTSIYLDQSWCCQDLYFIKCIC